jgi:hypothetical protein
VQPVEPRAALRLDALKPVPNGRGSGADALREDLVLALEVRVERRLRHVQPLGDVVHADAR